MIITFLGTGSGAPTTRRNVSGVALQFAQAGRWWLFDCGEGTQHQILRSPLKISQLEKVFITHLHGDHLYGLIGLLASRSLRNSDLSGITVYGPPGLKQYIDGIMAVSPVHLQYPLTVQTVEPGIVYADDELTVAAAPVRHRVPAFAYAVTELPSPGRFRVDLAQAAGIPPGPLYGRLKKGETVELPDGRILHGSDFIGPPVPGRKLAISGDTEPCANMIELARDADLLIHEATYAHSEVELARRSGHSTAREAAEVASQAGAKGLILTHFSPRYENDENHSLADLLAEARAIFPQTELAEDFRSFALKRKREMVGGMKKSCYNE
ncbi:ribonuclease Z [Brevibacillus sp. SYP-B805]|uniref:ribonuclease Z n=1 Tax=Brevibacillus sp. SYP-B805 TaxID=1578199 RepID=UPI0013EB841E|nr:ribonuclease Z [Brevibacillus sp. SYP-B805]NGQ94784.1 ribonuclease Z [Brevibacillus sp. SYP-B805]